MNKPDKIVVHHTADGSQKPQLLNINEWHRQRGFPLSSRGFFVGYHYVIEPDGTVIQTREDDEEGAHCKGQNFSSIGIGLSGNFDLCMPNTKQIWSLQKLMAVLVERHNIDPQMILPHRAYKDTSCYGRLLSDHWAKDLYKVYIIGLLGAKIIQLREKLINFTHNV